MAVFPITLTAADRLRLSAAACFHPGDAAQDGWLDYHGRTVRLNETAGEILRRCNGEITVRELIDDLVVYYDGSSASDISEAVHVFLSQALIKGWVDLSADLG